MSADLPKRPVQHVSGDRAVARVHLAVPPKWIVRDQTGDYGIDVEIEYADDVATGRIFKAQVKGHQSMTWDAAEMSREKIRPETMAYWRELPVPVVVFSVDNGSEEVFWSPTATDLGTSKDIVVHRALKLPETADMLLHHVLTWRDARSHRADILALANLDRRLRQKFKNDLGYDSPMAMEEDEIDLTQELYEQVIRLREALGLHTPALLPWQIWVARTKRIFGDAARLVWGTHDELCSYLKPLYEEAFSSAKELVAKEPATHENVALRAYLCDYRVQEMLSNPFDEMSDDLWAQFESALDASGASKFRRRP
jgi:hypothetical protein